MKKQSRLFISLVLVLFNVSVYAQSGDMQQVAIPLSHPDKPGKLKVRTCSGSDYRFRVFRKNSHRSISG